MAKQRKRFYVAEHYNGARNIVSLRVKPTFSVLKFLCAYLSHSSTIVRIAGPFRTFDDASRRIAQV